jgi:DNA-binding transcriptional LysR family regulator
MSRAIAPQGPVRLTASMPFGITHFAWILPDLCQAYPQVLIDLHLGDEVLDLARCGFDLALRIAALVDSTLRARRLCRIRRLPVGAPACFARHGSPRSWRAASSAPRWRWRTASCAPGGRNADRILTASDHDTAGEFAATPTTGGKKGNYAALETLYPARFRRGPMGTLSKLRIRQQCRSCG